MGVMEYIRNEIQNSGVFYDNINIDRLEEYAGSCAITHIPGTPMAKKYLRNDSDRYYAFALEWREMQITDEMRAYNNQVCENLINWMEKRNRYRRQNPPISETETVLAWDMLDGGMAAELDMKGAQMYIIQCALRYYKEA